MKLHLLTLLFSAVAANGAVTASSTVTPFTALGTQTDSLETNADGSATFLGTSNNGSGIVLSPGTGADNPFTTTAPTYFNFSAAVNNTPIEIFFGEIGPTPTSSAPRNSDTTAFSLGLDEDGVTTRSLGTASLLSGLPGAPFAVGTLFNFEVVVTPTESVTPGSFFFDYDVLVTVDGTSSQAIATGIRANQNAQPAAAVADYVFAAIGTRNPTTSNPSELSPNLVGPLTISNEPITVPEPSMGILLMLGCAATGLRRRR